MKKITILLCIIFMGAVTLSGCSEIIGFVDDVNEVLYAAGDKAVELVKDEVDMALGYDKTNPADVVERYFKKLKNMKYNDAVALVTSETLKSSTLVTVLYYSSSKESAKETGTDVLKYVRDFKYELSEPVYSENKESVVIRVSLKTLDITAVSDLAVENIMNNYDSIPNILSDYEKVYKEYLEKTIKSSPININLDVDFTLNKIESSWAINSTSDDARLCATLLGNYEGCLTELDESNNDYTEDLDYYEGNEELSEDIMWFDLIPEDDMYLYEETTTDEY